jgi:P27 family predicted phage terminase small subunit
MGRQKTPNKVLVARGSKKARTNEPEPADGEVVPTRELTPQGQAAWIRLCAQLDHLGYLSPTYADWITMAADAIGDVEIACEDLRARGHITITERGEVKNPSFTIKVSAQTTAYRYLTALGLSPTAIGKLAGTPKAEENPFAAFLQ